MAASQVTMDDKPTLAPRQMALAPPSSPAEIVARLPASRSLGSSAQHQPTRTANATCRAVWKVRRRSLSLVRTARPTARTRLRSTTKGPHTISAAPTWGQSTLSASRCQRKPTCQCHHLLLYRNHPPPLSDVAATFVVIMAMIAACQATKNVVAVSQATPSLRVAPHRTANACRHTGKKPSTNAAPSIRRRHPPHPDRPPPGRGAKVA